MICQVAKSFSDIKNILSALNDFGIKYGGALDERGIDWFEGTPFNGCPHNVPQRWTGNPNAKVVKEKDYGKTLRELRCWAMKFNKEALDDTDIKDCVNILRKGIRVLHYRDEEFKNRVFTGRKKGTARYNRYYQSKIMDWSNAFGMLRLETFGLTITYDAKYRGGNRWLAWKCFKDDYARLRRYIQERLGGKMVLVMESTKNQYPHAHILIGLPRGSISGYNKMPNQKSLRYGKFVREIRKRLAYPIFELQKIYGDNIKWYLTKYIGKMATSNFFAIGKKSEPLTEVERKEAMGVIATTLTKTKMFNFPIMRNRRKPTELSLAEIFALEGEAKDELLQAMYESAQRKKRLNKMYRRCIRLGKKGNRQEFLAATAAYLICLCTNSPNAPPVQIYMLSLSAFETIYDVPFEELQGKSDADFVKFKKSSCVLGCNGCLFSHIVQFVRNGNDEWFTPMFEGTRQKNIGETIFLLAQIVKLMLYYTKKLGIDMRTFATSKSLRGIAPKIVYVEKTFNFFSQKEIREIVREYEDIIPSDLFIDKLAKRLVRKN